MKKFLTVVLISIVFIGASFSAKVDSTGAGEVSLSTTLADTNPTVKVADKSGGDLGTLKPQITDNKVGGIYVHADGWNYADTHTLKISAAPTTWDGPTKDISIALDCASANNYISLTAGRGTPTKGAEITLKWTAPPDIKAGAYTATVTINYTIE